MLSNPDSNENKKCLDCFKAFFIVMDSRNMETKNSQAIRF